jgi:hypothetical protein
MLDHRLQEPHHSDDCRPLKCRLMLDASPSKDGLIAREIANDASTSRATLQSCRFRRTKRKAIPDCRSGGTAEAAMRSDVHAVRAEACEKERRTVQRASSGRGVSVDHGGHSNGDQCANYDIIDQSKRRFTVTFLLRTIKGLVKKPPTTSWWTSRFCVRICRIGNA